MSFLKRIFSDTLHHFVKTVEGLLAIVLGTHREQNTCLNPQFVFDESDKAQIQKGKICPIHQNAPMSGINWAHCLPATQIYWSRCDVFLDMAFQQ